MIHVDGLTLTLGTFAIQSLDLHVQAGEYFVLLGPSGSGKTLLLESLCGLHRIDSGHIRIHGTDVTQFEPRQRSLGYLPQDYALFPHLSVRSNVGFGLGNPLSLACGTARARIDETMCLVSIEHIAHRRPGNLSGGEKQRVALARALAVQPRVILLDEPVSALDEQTRDQLCRQLKRIQRETGTTTIHVCHNFAEMMAVADRVGIIHQGQIIQVGTPQEILRKPKTSFIARFMQGNNVHSATATEGDDWVRLACDDSTITLLAARNADAMNQSSVHFVVRPESIQVLTTPPAAPSRRTTVLEGRCLHVADLGPLVQLRVRVESNIEFLVSMGKREYLVDSHAVDDTVFLVIDANDVHVMTS